MRLTVNGVEHEISSPPLTALLHVLREELEITSPKARCQQGASATCTVLVDGEPRRSCLLPVGYAQPGMIVAATALIERKGGAVEREEVLEALGGHYCRCTGYVKIVDAVVAASRGEFDAVADVPSAGEGEPDVLVKGSPA